MNTNISIVDSKPFEVISQLIKGLRGGTLGKEGNSHFMIVSSSLLWC